MHANYPILLPATSVVATPTTGSLNVECASCNTSPFDICGIRLGSLAFSWGGEGESPAEVRKHIHIRAIQLYYKASGRVWMTATDGLQSIFITVITELPLPLPRASILSFSSHPSALFGWAGLPPSGNPGECIGAYWLAASGTTSGRQDVMESRTEPRKIK